MITLWVSSSGNCSDGGREGGRERRREGGRVGERVAEEGERERERKKRREKPLRKARQVGRGGRQSKRGKSVGQHYNTTPPPQREECTFLHCCSFVP